MTRQPESPSPPDVMSTFGSTLEWKFHARVYTAGYNVNEVRQTCPLAPCFLPRPIKNILYPLSTDLDSLNISHWAVGSRFSVIIVMYFQPDESLASSEAVMHRVRVTSTPIQKIP